MQFLLHNLKSYNRLLKLENFFKIFNIITSPLCVLFILDTTGNLADWRKNQISLLVLIMNSTTNTPIHPTPISDMSNSYSSCNVFLAIETRRHKISCHETKWTEYFDSVAKLDVYVMHMRFLISILEITSQTLNTYLHTVITSKLSINVKWNS